uniref:Uncharacterized protein n=1 Tax=Arundo donax TaxID=35708 RepID=A0A0A9AHW1_ARUDO
MDGRFGPPPAPPDQWEGDRCGNPHGLGQYRPGVK